MIEVKSQEILLTVDGATLRVGVTYHTPDSMISGIPSTPSAASDGRQIRGVGV
jgi:hypothetical protein